MSILKIKYICPLVESGMEPLSERSVHLSLEKKILNCLKALRSDSFQAVVAILLSFSDYCEHSS